MTLTLFLTPPSPLSTPVYSMPSPPPSHNDMRIFGPDPGLDVCAFRYTPLSSALPLTPLLPSFILPPALVAAATPGVALFILRLFYSLRLCPIRPFWPVALYSFLFFSSVHTSSPRPPSCPLPRPPSHAAFVSGSLSNRSRSHTHRQVPGFFLLSPFSFFFPFFLFPLALSSPACMRDALLFL